MAKSRMLEVTIRLNGKRHCDRLKVSSLKGMKPAELIRELIATEFPHSSSVVNVIDRGQCHRLDRGGGTM